ncbi:MAG: tRNA dihydrouridine synthase DusB [Bacteroidales bacterium]|nr:tRNA dihydrouridine synthase DusB [Bacteroidales bacterium]
MVKIGNIEVGDFPIILAPMENITDQPFRKICKRFGADLMFTEFISSEGLIRDAQKSVKKLNISEEERPIGIQIFGHNIDFMSKAAQMAEESNPDFIDLNFGCPVKKVVSKGAGAAMLKDIPKLINITKAVIKSTKLPVTVKTRLGWDVNSKIITPDFTERLQDIGVKALSIHARTKTQLYKGISDWTLIGKIKNNQRLKIPVFGNGDIDSPEKALLMKNKYNVDGIMIGRASIGYPWIFNEIKYFFKNNKLAEPPDINERVKVCKEHLYASIDLKGERRAINEIRKHYHNYFKSYKNFKRFKLRLYEATELEDLLLIFDDILLNYS